MKRLILTSLTLAALAAAAGCESTGIDTRQLAPIIGEQNAHGLSALGHGWNAMTLSEKDEQSLGQSIGVALTNQYPVIMNDRLQRYVALVGLTVASASPNPTGNWIFGVIDSPDVNAFSGPGGVVLITRGALDRMQDEAELAGVLAHEVGHVCHHDGLEQVRGAEMKGAAVEGMQAGGGQASSLAGMADTGLNVVTTTGFSQPQELKADHDAVGIMSAAGYDPAAYLRFLQRLQQEGASHPGGRLMSTHPGIDKRIGTVTQAMHEVRPGGATLRDRFVYNVRTGPAAPAPQGMVGPQGQPMPAYPAPAQPYPAPRPFGPAPMPTYVPPTAPPAANPGYTPAPSYTPAPPR